MGHTTNIAFASYLLHRSNGGLTRDEFYREAQDVGWLGGENRDKWTKKYTERLFEGRGDKEFIFFFDGQRLKLTRPDIYPLGFDPITVHNTLCQYSAETIKKARDSGKVFNSLELMVAMAEVYERESGKTLYQLALEEHKKDSHAPIPMDPSDPPGTKYYEIEVDVSVGGISHDRSLPRMHTIVARMLRESKERIRRFSPDGAYAREAREELARWKSISEKLEQADELLSGSYPMRHTFELKSLNGPPMDDARLKALSEAVKGLETTEQENTMLAKLGFAGIKVDRASVGTEVKGIVNLSKKWLEEELRMLSDFERMQ
ncbi:MAG: hypothetical protein HY512_01095 [Candidatus Aenigmarchaeota archaeon]|nr:hypothetical protein [Candidatus Aenigmarchaeota archaeon]